MKLKLHANATTTPKTRAYIRNSKLSARRLASELGIACAPRADHAQYIAQYLKLLKSDSRAIFTAAAKANQAVAFLKAFSEVQPGETAAAA